MLALFTLSTLQGDGAHLAACINAATLALADAGVAMRDLVSACCCALVPAPVAPHEHNGDAPTTVSCVADVCYAEEGAGSGCARVTMATLPRNGQIVLMELEHRVHVDHVPLLIDEAQRACHHVSERLRAALQPHVRTNARRLQWI